MSKTIVTTCPVCGDGKVLSEYEYAPDAGDGKAWAAMIPCEKHLFDDFAKAFAPSGKRA